MKGVEDPFSLSNYTHLFFQCSVLPFQPPQCGEWLGGLVRWVGGVLLGRWGGSGRVGGGSGWVGGGVYPGGWGVWPGV